MYRKFALRILTICAYIGISASAIAQEGSDIWIGKLDMQAQRPISDIFPVTDNELYSNQPYFFNNNLLFYSQAVKLDDESEQIDTFVFDFTLGEAKNLTQSATSEYSPTPLPYKNGLSVIRVNEDGKQQLWELDAQGKAKKHLVPQIEPVGYQVWLNKEELLLFVLGEPHELRRVNTKTANDYGFVIDTDIGASLFQFKQTKWFFYTSKSEGNYLHAMNIENNKPIQIFEMPENTEYFAITPSGVLLSSDGNTIWKRQIVLADGRPTAVEDFSQINVSQTPCDKGISRMAVSPDESMIAIVCARTSSAE